MKEITDAVDFVECPICYEKMDDFYEITGCKHKVMKSCL